MKKSAATAVKKHKVIFAWAGAWHEGKGSERIVCVKARSRAAAIKKIHAINLDVIYPDQIHPVAIIAPKFVDRKKFQSWDWIKAFEKEKAKR